MIPELFSRATPPALLLFPWWQIGWAMLAIWVFVACLPSDRLPLVSPRLLQATLVVSTIFWFRWPLFWLPYGIHPDESQLIAGARTLLQDPLFWRSVDGNTAGPVDFFVLLPAALAPDVGAFAFTRITSMVLMAAAAILTGEALARWTNRTIANLAILPFVLFEAFTANPEYYSYSTEVVPVFLTALVLYLIVGQLQQPGPLRAAVIAFLLGAMPLTKLQAGPLAAALGLALLGWEIRQRRFCSAVGMITAALIPIFLTGSILIFAGEAENALTSYFRQNLLYTATGRVPLSSNLSRLWVATKLEGYLPCWLASGALLLILASVFSRRTHATIRWILLASFAFVAVAFGCMVAPGRAFPHYLALLFVPFTFAIGCALTAINETGLPGLRTMHPKVLRLAPLILVGPLLLLRLWPRPDPHADTNLMPPPTSHEQLVAQLRAGSRPGESLAIWGWRSELYVEADLRQATRQAVSESQIVSGPWQSYFLRTYFDDFRRQNPPVFVDTVGPGGFRFSDRRWAHEAFPPLRDWIATHYRLVQDYEGARLYLRKDRLGWLSPTRSQ